MGLSGCAKNVRFWPLYLDYLLVLRFQRVTLRDEVRTPFTRGCRLTSYDTEFSGPLLSVQHHSTFCSTLMGWAWGRDRDKLPMVSTFFLWVMGLSSHLWDPVAWILWRWPDQGCFLQFGNDSYVLPLPNYPEFSSSYNLSGFLVFLTKWEAQAQVYCCAWKNQCGVIVR